MYKNKMTQRASSLRERVSTLVDEQGALLVGAGFISNTRSHNVVHDPGMRDYRWLLMLAGSGSCTDEHGETYQLQYGSLFTRAPQTPHVVRRSRGSSWLEFYIRIPAATHAQLCALGIIDSTERFRQLQADTSLEDQLHSVVTQMAHNPSPGRASALALTAEVFALRDRYTATNDQRIETIRAHIDEDPRRVDLAALAAAHDLTRDGLRLAFRRRFGCSPKQYQVRARIRQAESRLLAGQSVSAVAEALGYPDPFAFSKQFKHIVGMPPSQFAAT